MSRSRKPRGGLFVLSAPSGTGKTTMIRRMLSRGLLGNRELVFSVSHTARPPRRGEVDGKDYHFVDRSTFERMIAEERFLEWALVHEQYKGTSRDEVLPRLERGTDVLLDVDVQGAKQVLERYPRAVSIFIMPPSFEALEKRIVSRALDSPRQIGLRLAVSLSEIECYKRYRYVIINHDLDRASQALAAIILEKRHRRERMEATVREILEGFPRPGAQPDEEE